MPVHEFGDDALESLASKLGGLEDQLDADERALLTAVLRVVGDVIRRTIDGEQLTDLVRLDLESGEETGETTQSIQRAFLEAFDADPSGNQPGLFGVGIGAVGGGPIININPGPGH
jgi:hypothetical protein